MLESIFNKRQKDKRCNVKIIRDRFHIITDLYMFSKAELFELNKIFNEICFFLQNFQFIMYSHTKVTNSVLDSGTDVQYHCS